VGFQLFTSGKDIAQKYLISRLYYARFKIPHVMTSLFGCSHRQWPRCYSSKLVASAVEAASKGRLPLVREAYAQLFELCREKACMAWKCSLATTSSLTLWQCWL